MINPTSAKILIIDDEDMIRETLIDILEDEDYQAISAGNANEAKAKYQEEQPDLVLLDIWMPDLDGISLLREWQNDNALICPVVMMSGHGTIETAVEATKLGAYDFLEKPLSTAKLLLTVERALQAQALKKQNAELKAKIDPPIEIIGRSPQMQTLREQADFFAKQQMPILMIGEAGTGKQHIGHYLHQHHTNQNGAFVVFNASAMDKEFMIPALIGQPERSGIIAQANNGTLYIDEITVLPAEAQKILLGIIEQNHYLSGYAGTQQGINTRLIIASHYGEAIIKDSISDALFDHITVAKINLPSLNEHNADVPELLDYFSQYFADYEQLPYRHFSLAAQNILRQHKWNGNIRELRNLVQRLLVQSDAPEIDVQEAEKALTPVQVQVDDGGLWSQIIPLDLSLREARELFEHQYLLEQFRHCDGNVAQLANRVGMDRTNLYRKLRGLGIDPTQKPD